MEVWTSSTPTLQGECGGVQYAQNGDVLFGCLQYKTHHKHALEKDTQQAYRNILNLLESQGYPHLLRMWNYFPRINDFEGSLERYQQFCVGRFLAFQEIHGDNFNTKLPAASAIGTRVPGLSVYFLASRKPGKHIENPRQISAYHYPEKYGTCSPSFARATHKKWGAMQHLYISGTASIVGHQTLHCGDVQKQTEETLENIDKLLQHAMGVNHKHRSSFAMIKVYLRNAEHRSLVTPILEKKFGYDTPLLYVEGDICRSDLLIEIEGVCSIHQN
jgi:chorismate lyase/3-hydroxybenzoate synthase